MKVGKARRTLGVVLLAAAAACGGGGGDADGGGEAAPAAGSAPSPSPEVVAQLDSGTVAYRAGRLEEARRHYRTAAEANPHSASAWFGVHMAEKALGNGEEADSALARARRLAPDRVPEAHGGDGSMYEHAPPPSDPERRSGEGGARSSS